MCLLTASQQALPFSTTCTATTRQHTPFHPTRTRPADLTRSLRRCPHSPHNVHQGMPLWVVNWPSSYDHTTAQNCTGVALALALLHFHMHAPTPHQHTLHNQQVQITVELLEKLAGIRPKVSPKQAQAQRQKQLQQQQQLARCVFVARVFRSLVSGPRVCTYSTDQQTCCTHQMYTGWVARLLG